MKIKMLVMDVDGTMTDGNIYMSASGEAFKAFNIKDGYSIYTLYKYGITPVIITGRESQIVARRAEELKISEVHQGVHDKLAMLHEVMEKHHVTIDEVAYIGDDYNDMDCMKICCYVCFPSDADSDIKPYVHYVCKSKAGEGAIREFVKVLLKQ